MKIAIAHDYLTQRGGAERVVLAMAEAFPDAPIYTMLYDPRLTFPEFRDLDVRTPLFNRLPAARRHHRVMAPVLPLVARSIEIPADVVICSSSGWSHGFRTKGRKVVYCHSPARWVYQTEHFFRDDGRGVIKAAAVAMRPALRAWDRRAAGTVDTYLANSTEVQGRIYEAYRRTSRVVMAPAMSFLADHAEPHDGGDDGYFLVVARLRPYKNVEAVVRAFAGRPERLVVVGTGPDRHRLEQLAGPNVDFLSGLTDDHLRVLYQRCRAVVCASYEDLGLVPIEAAVVGRPAIALRWGGFLDTVTENVNGLFFDKPEPAAISAAIDRFNTKAWDREGIREHAERFSEARFIATLRDVVTHPGPARYQAVQPAPFPDDELDGTRSLR